MYEGILRPTPWPRFPRFQFSKVLIGNSKGNSKMHTHENALKILNCSKMTLSRYVKDGKLERQKKGRKTFYDEHQVAALVLEIENNKKKVGIEIKPKEKIELPVEVERELKNLSADSLLTAVGMEKLSTATKSLIDLGLYKKCDKETLLCYALSAQSYNYFYVKSMKIDSVNVDGQIAELEDGTKVMFIGKVSVHSFHKIMIDHQKMMLNYMDRLGLNPLSRTKFDIKEKETPISIMDELHKKETW